MRRIRDWSVRARLFLAFGGILFPLVVFVSIGMSTSRTARQDLAQIEEEAAIDLAREKDLRLAWDQLILAMNDYMVVGGLKERIQVERHVAHLKAAFRAVATLPNQDAEERHVIGALGSIASRIEARSQEVLAAPNPLTNRDTRVMIEALIRLNDHLVPVLYKLQEITLNSVEVLTLRASELNRQTETTSLIAILLGVAGAATSSILFSGWLSRPILAITRGSRRMVEGDLSQRVDVNTGGELGEAAAAFNAMAERLETSTIENTRLYNAAAQRAERIAAINRLIMVISSSLDLGAVYKAFAEELKPFLPFTRMGIIVPETPGKRLRVLQLAADQPGTAKVGKVWSSGKGTGIEWVMTHRQPHIESDLAEARLFVEDEIVLNEGMRSTVRLPLIMKGEVIGAFFLDDVVPGRYTESDLGLLVPLGEQLAIAIENARLHDELERKVEERTMALRQTQAQLIQSGKLAAVGTLAAGVAHELNQPLMVIRGYAQELLADERVVCEEICEDLRRIEAQTTRMAAIINHLRDFSRQSKGKRDVTNLNRVVTDALAFLAQQLKAKNIVVVQELRPGLPPVWADPMQIEQVLLNLVTNARDAMEEDGTGTITIRTELAAGSRVGLSVTDTGPGIPSDLQMRIFDPFFTTKEVGKGTGLGLSICHGIVEEHGGALTMESPAADGRGARFTIVLPCSLRVENTDPWA